MIHELQDGGWTGTNGFGLSLCFRLGAGREALNDVSIFFTN